MNCFIARKIRSTLHFSAISFFLFAISADTYAGSAAKQNSDQEIIKKPLLGRLSELIPLTRAPFEMIESERSFFQKRDMYFFGRIDGEAVNFSSGVLADDSGVDVRRLRLGVVGRFANVKELSYKLEFDLGDSENRLADVYLGWNSERWGSVHVGNQKISQGLSGQASSLSMSFMERPLPVLAFNLQRRLGLVYQYQKASWGFKGTLFGHDINNQYGSNGYAARGYYRLAAGDTEIHLGGSILKQNTRNDRAQVRALPESYGTNIRLVDTGEIDDVAKEFTYSLEAALATGPYAIRSEFYHADWHRRDHFDPRFKGWYMEGSWFITGEKQIYRHGQFYRPKVLSNEGGWEVAARYSTVDLNSEGITGGTESNWSAGINWYSPLHWRVMGNIIKVDADGPRGKEDLWISQIRVQYYF